MASADRLFETMMDTCRDSPPTIWCYCVRADEMVLRTEAKNPQEIADRAVIEPAGYHRAIKCARCANVGCCVAEASPTSKSSLPIALSIHRRWSRQCDPIENFADKKVSLNGGQVFSYDLVVEPQTKQASRVAWGFKLNDNPLD